MANNSINRIEEVLIKVQNQDNPWLADYYKIKSKKKKKIK